MNNLGNIIESLPEIAEQHAPNTSLYQLLDNISKSEAKNMFNSNPEGKRNLGPIGDFFFPFFKMGAISSIDLFGLDELIIFSFYWKNRNRYKNVLDIGANIGLHSTVLALCGYAVSLYEPDPVHFAKISETLKENNINNVSCNQAAVSNYSGEAEFVRVLGNTTSSHISGSKEPYGELEKFKVPVVNIADIIKTADFFKMDVEGHETTIIEATTSADWSETDAIIEVGAEKHAAAIYEHLQKIQVNAFSQKTGWDIISKLEDMPTSYKQGSLFITKKSSMPW